MKKHHLFSTQFRTSRTLELDAIQEAEKGNLAEALALMSKAMALTPTRASCFNNRAQVHRFNSDISAALQDLNKAIQISHGIGRSACQAFCQRGTYIESDPKTRKPLSSADRAQAF